MSAIAEGLDWRLHQADALSVLRRLPAGSIAALFTDPPYCSGGWSATARRKDPADKYHAGTSQCSFTGDQRDQRAFRVWCERWLGEATRVLEDRAPVAVCSDWRQLPTVTDAVQVAGLVWRGIITWRKANGRPNPNLPRCESEFLVFATKGGIPAMDPPVYLPGVIEAAAPRGQARRHMTEKPVDLWAPLVGLVQPGGVILDPFAGSGSTGEAALQAGRRFIGCEWSAEYHRIAAERLAGRAATATGRAAE